MQKFNVIHLINLSKVSDWLNRDLANREKAYIRQSIGVSFRIYSEAALL
jgi:hypothetical protein